MSGLDWKGPYRSQNHGMVGLERSLKPTHGLVAPCTSRYPGPDPNPMSESIVPMLPELRHHRAVLCPTQLRGRTFS